MPASLEDLLELCLITYNRAADLEKTLAQLLNSPVAGCRLTVFDNASPDATPEVCAHYAAKFPRCVIRRHSWNLGLGANYLRAVEALDKEYAWILCDDDDLDFTHFAEVATALCSGQHDLISLGVPHHAELPRGVATNAMDLVRNPRWNYIYTHSFIPSLIFRRSGYTAEIIRAGYNAIPTLFPHLPLVLETLRQNLRVYVTRHDFITFRQENVGYRPLHLMIGWLQVANQLADPALVRIMCREVLGRAFYPRKIAQYALLERGFLPHRSITRDARRLALEAMHAGWWWWLKALPFVLLLVLPPAVSRWLWYLCEQWVRFHEGRHLKRPARIEFADGDVY